MRSLDVAIVGAGPSGMLAADKLLGSAQFDAEVTLFERCAKIGGIPTRYRSVAPNSPHHDLNSFLMDLQAESAFSEEGEKTAAAILRTARETPTLGKVAEAFDLLWEDLLSQDKRLELQTNHEISMITETPDGRYNLEVCTNGRKVNSMTADVVISAIGAVPRKNPYRDSFAQEIGIEKALDPSQNVFSGKKVVIIGASHSGAIAFCNAVEQGAKQIEVWYKDSLFKEHSIDGTNVKHYQFTGINEPTLGRLKKAMAQYRSRFECKKITESNSSSYQGWHVVSTVGFERPSLQFTSSKSTGELTTILQGEEFGSVAPNLCYPGTNEPIPRVYGLGIAYPLTFTERFLANSVEAPNAKVVGIYFTNELTKLLVPNIIGNWPETRV